MGRYLDIKKKLNRADTEYARHDEAGGNNKRNYRATLDTQPCLRKRRVKRRHNDGCHVRENDQREVARDQGGPFAVSVEQREIDYRDDGYHNGHNDVHIKPPFLDILWILYPATPKRIHGFLARISSLRFVLVG